MRLGEVAHVMRPGFRIRISELDAVNEEERRIWSPTLSDAQIIAYENREVLSLRKEAASRTVFCIIANADARSMRVAPEAGEQKRQQGGSTECHR